MVHVRAIRISIGMCLLLLVVWLSVVRSQSTLVLRTHEVRVKVGRSVYLDRDDLHIVRLRRGEDCRVEVVMADPITQRVGHMDPPVSTRTIAVLCLCS